MTINVTSKTLSAYNAQLAFNTAKAYLSQSGLADYLIKQLEKQDQVQLSIEVSGDPAHANENASDDGKIFWSLRSDALYSDEASDVSSLLDKAPAERKPYIASHLNLLHVLALACEQLNNHLNFRDADATWPWLDETTLSASDIENFVARELLDQSWPADQNWDRVLKDS